MDAADRTSLLALEGWLAAALRAEDPGSPGATPSDLPPELAAAVATIDPDGLRLAALLVAKLRFERLMQGSASARDWFEEDGAGFAAAFRQYHRAIPPRSPDPWGETRDFEAWVAAREPAPD